MAKSPSLLRLLILAAASGVVATAMLAAPVPMFVRWVGFEQPSLASRSSPFGVPSTISRRDSLFTEVWSVVLGRRQGIVVNWNPEYFEAAISNADSGPAPAFVPESIPEPPPAPAWVVTEFKLTKPRAYVDGLSTTATGWPFRALSFVHWSGSEYPLGVPMARGTSVDIDGIAHGWRIGTDRYLPLVIPTRPIWPGLAANILIWSVVSVPCIRGAYMLRARLRRQRGLCSDCAYVTAGLPAQGVCPECGRRLA
ncbi:MAG: hypothetical protein ACREJO_00500 [Phycisphaerales bacterium]